MWYKWGDTVSFLPRIMHFPSSRVILLRAYSVTGQYDAKSTQRKKMAITSYLLHIQSDPPVCIFSYCVTK